MSAIDACSCCRVKPSARAELVLLNTDAASRRMATTAPLTDWQNGIGRLTAGQRLGVLAVSTAFAGPLLHLSGQDGGGIHIRGSSSTGKTSLARAAASVWGPRHIYAELARDCERAGRRRRSGNRYLARSG